MKRLLLSLSVVALIGAGCPSKAPATSALPEAPVLQDEKGNPIVATSSAPTNGTAPKTTTKPPTQKNPQLQPSAPVVKPKPGPQTLTVTITSTGFSPQTMAINVGDSIVWVNKSGTSQTTASTAAFNWDSGNIANGASYKRTFTAAGSYGYYSGSSNFKGTIVVH
ncbi:MAG: hypothetical protein WC787_03345 [Patescibacteria group bacterium]|jgi:plastocyanin